MPPSDTAPAPAVELADPRVARQPVSQVRWVAASSLHANDYNPNQVARPELRLLKQSIMENGWTQPIVVIGSEVVDGFHRWTLGATDKDIIALTGGLVPVVPLALADTDRATQIMATIRHNRARGVHRVLPMADIVRALIDDHGLDAADLKRRLQMDAEEIDRLYDSGGMRARGSRPAGFNHGWTPG